MHGVAARAELRAAWRLPRNRHLELAVAGSLALLLATIYIPALHGPFGTVSLSATEFMIVLALAVVPALVAESAKAAVRSRARRIS